MRAAVVTVSDRSFRGERPDVSGPVLAQLAAAAGAEIVEQALVPDETGLITATLKRLVDDAHCAAVFTTGGTGVSPRDVTPEATLQVIDRRLTGIEAAILHDGLTRTPLAMLSRAVVGVRGHALIANFPGSPKAVRECFAVVGPVLGHVLTLLRDENPHEARAR